MTIVPLIRKLERLGPLPDEGRRELEDLSLDPGRVAAGRNLVGESERPTRCWLLIEGFACRYKTLRNGRRQIVSFHLAGDITDLTGLLLDEVDCGIAALTPALVAPIACGTLRGWMHSHPGLGRLLWRDAMIDAAVSREWLVNVGRRSALARTAHLLCELVTRLRAVGLAHDHVCELPLTQVALADALSLSHVHVNRMVQELRGAGLIEWGDGTLVVRDWDGLKRAGEFDPRYLHRLADAAWGGDAVEPGTVAPCRPLCSCSARPGHARGNRLRR